jgi:hypothetical protein
MTTGPGELHARSVRCDALRQPSRGDADDRAPGVFDGPGDRALVGRRQVVRAGEFADGMLSSSGAQT